MDIIYRAINGEEFYDRKQCEIYERNIMENTANDYFRKAMENLSKICEFCSCCDCPARTLCDNSEKSWSAYLEGLD